MNKANKDHCLGVTGHQKRSLVEREPAESAEAKPQNLAFKVYEVHRKAGIKIISRLWAPNGLLTRQDSYSFQNRHRLLYM